jgi:hypothetical protein
MKKENSNNEKGDNKPTLMLIINKNKYEWPQQYITGVDIRKLADIPDEEELFLSIRVPWKDELISRDTEVDLARPGIEHFFSKKPCMVIIVNGREKEWCKEKICFDEVVRLAFEDYVENAETVYTVTYKRGPHQNPEGSIVKGECVYVKAKMIFNVTATNKS